MVLAAIHKNLKIQDLIARSLELPKRSDYFDFHPRMLSKASKTDDSFENKLYCTIIFYLFLLTFSIKLISMFKSSQQY